MYYTNDEFSIFRPSQTMTMWRTRCPSIWAGRTISWQSSSRRYVYIYLYKIYIRIINRKKISVNISAEENRKTARSLKNQWPEKQRQKVRAARYIFNDSPVHIYIYTQSHLFPASAKVREQKYRAASIITNEKLIRVSSFNFPFAISSSHRVVVPTFADDETGFWCARATKAGGSFRSRRARW